MATPTKRRVLGSLDVNVQMSPRSPKVAASPLKKATSREASAALSRHASPSPRKAGSRVATPKKRVLEEEEAAQQPVVKKLCSEPTSATGRDGNAAVESTAKHAMMLHAHEDRAPASQPAVGRRSISPDASSLFDTSVMNTSEDTTITEPDTDAPITITTAAAAFVPPSVTDRLTSLPSPPPPPPRRVPTREEFRQKAEILRLRLSLATYKVKTGQADVPLEKLQVRPVPGMTRRRTPLPSMSAHMIQQSTPAQQWYRSRGTPLPGKDHHDCVVAVAEEEKQRDEEQQEDDGSTGDKVAGGARDPSPPAETETETERNVLPRLPAPSAVSTPRKRRNEDEDEARLTSSALRGGAAKGLLSLSQGSL